MLLDKSREDNSGVPRRQWYTVDFPAWRLEKSECLWAALTKTIYEEHQKQMSSTKARVRFRLSLDGPAWGVGGTWGRISVCL